MNKVPRHHASQPPHFRDKNPKAQSDLVITLPMLTLEGSLSLSVDKKASPLPTIRPSSGQKRFSLFYWMAGCMEGLGEH